MMALNPNIDCIHCHMCIQPSSTCQYRGNLYENLYPLRCGVRNSMWINCSALSVKPRTNVQINIISRLYFNIIVCYVYMLQLNLTLIPFHVNVGKQEGIGKNKIIWFLPFNSAQLKLIRFNFIHNPSINFKYLVRFLIVQIGKKQKAFCACITEGLKLEMIVGCLICKRINLW